MIRSLTVLLLAVVTGTTTAWGAGVSVTVTDINARPIEDVVVVFEAGAAADHAGAAPKSTAAAPHVTIDQRNMRFVPEISVVRSGTAIDFPNSDQIRHQVYSFSPAKNFKLALYAGHVYPPLVFDKSGLVTLGCNIHDSMIGFVYVTDSPWFGKTDANGRVELAALPPGDYRAVLWHPRFAETEPQIERAITIASHGETAVTVGLKHAMRPLPSHNTSQRWQGY
jgi:plastocyanin